VTAPAAGAGDRLAGRVASRTLADLAKGARATILSLDGRDAVVQRLLEMGLTEGAGIEVVRFAPLGDPIEVRVRGYLLSLRRDDARRVHVADG
jgi:Fe2+ transport system protein FeoA